MRRMLSLALSLLGLFASLYLLWAYTSPSHPMVCLGSGCDEVRASAYAKLAGMPVPIFGMAGYLTLALAILIAALADEELGRVIQYAIAGLSAVGFLFSLYLTYLEAFVIHAWCAWCVGSALAITCIFVLAVLEVTRPAPWPASASRLGRAQKELALLMLAALVGVPAFHYLTKQGEPAGGVRVPPSLILEHLVRPDSHIAGNPQAPVTVVEFADFQCPYCSRGEEVAKQIRAKYGNQIRFAFRQYPMAKIHAWAEKAAEASECAAEHGKFWEAVDRFFAGQNDLREPALIRYAAQLGLDPRHFQACLDSGAAASRVQRDLDDGRALGVTQTPTFFIGQLRIEGALQFDEFSELIDREIASRSGKSAETSSQAAVAPPRAGTPGSKVSTTPGSLAAGPDPFGAAKAGAFSTFQASSGACSEAEAAQKQPTLIGTQEVRQLLAGTPKPLFVDVRTATEYAQEHISAALNIPVDDLGRRWDTLPKDRTIVLYESGQATGDICAASRAAGRNLLTHGFSFERVKAYEDGLAGWKKAGLKTER